MRVRQALWPRQLHTLNNPANRLCAVVTLPMGRCFSFFSQGILPALCSRRPWGRQSIGECGTTAIALQTIYFGEGRIVLTAQAGSLRFTGWKPVPRQEEVGREDSSYHDQQTLKSFWSCCAEQYVETPGAGWEPALGWAGAGPVVTPP